MAQFKLFWALTMKDTFPTPTFSSTLFIRQIYTLSANWNRKSQLFTISKLNSHDFKYLYLNLQTKNAQLSLHFNIKVTNCQLVKSLKSWRNTSRGAKQVTDVFHPCTKAKAHFSTWTKHFVVLQEGYCNSKSTKLI